MNSRIREPLICPPNRKETSKLTSSDRSAGPSVAWTRRMARPMRWAAWNMVGAFISVSTSPVLGSSIPSVRVDSTDWLIARLPALAIAMVRSPGLEKMWSLRKVETLSRPALVRVSAIMTRPPSTSLLEESTIASVTPFAAIFNNLVVFDPAKPHESLETVIPDLAESWSWDATNTRLTFKLRRGVKWHDGQPFTAKDVQCTWRMLIGKGDTQDFKRNPRKVWYSKLRDISVSGD